MNSKATTLVHRESGALVRATIHSGLRPDDLVLAERSWAEHRARILAELLAVGCPRAQWPESLHWDWALKASDLELLDPCAYGVTCEGKWQGLMMTRTEPYVARLESGSKPIVYVDYLEVAPWNWRIAALSQVPQFKGTGGNLLLQALDQSMREGFSGRLGLHSLPHAEDYYKNLGMCGLGPDPQKQDLVYFEFTRDGAQKCVQDGTQ